MSKVADVIKHELKEAVFPTLFFLAVFYFGIVTKILILESYNVTPVAVASAIIGALIVAKAILIIDALPISRHFADSKLVVRVLWKALIYNVLVFLFRFIEELVPLWSQYGSFSVATSKMLTEVSWPHFWAVQIWLVVSVLAYSMIVGLDEHFGEGSIRTALFSRPKAGPRTDID